MKIRSTATAFCLTVVFICLYSINLHGQQTSNAYDSLASKVLKLINEHRTEMSLPPLVMMKPIISAARDHSQNMATGKIPFGHKGFDERMNRLSEKQKLPWQV